MSEAVAANQPNEFEQELTQPKREARKEEEMNDENIGSLPANVSTLLEAAINLHEMFITLMKSGFTEYQALYIVAQTIRPQKET